MDTFHFFVPIKRVLMTFHGFSLRVVVIVQQEFRPRTGQKAEHIVATVGIVEREQGTVFVPKFDSAGLLSAIVQDQRSNEVLMLAFMDQEALDKTIATGLAHFHSRSRGRLWMKGESSGNVLRVRSIRVDCDQDALLLRVEPEGPTCHTGARSCFYRELTNQELSRIEN